MNRLCRLGAMILLFLLLANLPLLADVPGPGDGGEASVPSSSVDRVSRRRTVSPGDSISYSQYPTLTKPTSLKPDVARVLLDADGTSTIRVIAYLRQQSDSDMAQTHPLSEATTVQKRAELITRLKGTARQTQLELRSYLAREQAAGRVSSYRPFWITNAIAIEAEPSVIRELATHPSVATVTLDHWRQWVGQAASDSAAARDPATHSDERLEQRLGMPVQDQPLEWNIARVRANEVWHSLHISGSNAVVAGVDTGVDWLHPALEQAYRGYKPHSPTDHTTSWFDATDGGALYPVDGNGHGTHTVGTMVGQDGIGVAPGARWIAVKVLNNQGFGYDSWIHVGFQWLMAPGGDPARAPDVANCSWGNSNAYLTTFQDDLRALRAAGILPVFASGNEGATSGTVTSPASLPEAFAVGAVDGDDSVATFSGRGPSPWGEIRPHVAAPGVHIRSSTPGGAYQQTNGTSMAAPHASGIAALVRSVSPTLSVSGVTRAITSTALPLDAAIPNNDTGWGRVDAFAAVSAVAQPGFLVGTVQRAGAQEPESASPIAGARVSARSRAGGGGADTTDSAGLYSLPLAPSTYDLTASAFGHEPRTIYGIDVVSHTTTVQDVNLAPLPTGTLEVSVIDASSKAPLTATVTVLETPYRSTTAGETFELPPGGYTVRGERLGYRVVTTTTSVRVGGASTTTLALPPAPSILLVDSGAWYYESQIAYFRQALDDLFYAYDQWSIRDLEHDVPASSDLARYDIVIWSAPWDAPGYIGADTAVGSYLEAGGRLLLTGQDVGFYDGGGSGYEFSPYYREYLKVRFVSDNAPTRALLGESGDIFAGQAITIAGSGGADNQEYPDVISIADSDAAAPVFRYQNDGCGGARVGTCLDYRAIYLPFGFEAISGRAARREVMGRSLEWLSASPPAAGLELQPQTQLGIAPAGSRVVHTVRLRHIGQGGESDRVSLTLDGASWQTELSDASLTLSPCTSSLFTISVTIPTTATWDVRDIVTLTAHSSLSPTLSVSATLETKSPAPVLLVDDDRWYDQQAIYTAAMASAGLRYDVWETSTPKGAHLAGPDSETLRRYPVVVWWTGYDWYDPVTSKETASLEAYLDGGGRLMLSSQDFLYRHRHEPFARDHLGVLSFTESITPTHLHGVSENPVGTDLGPWLLDYPFGYQNWSDGVVPAQNVGVAFRDQGRRGTALTRRTGSEAVLFLAFPFEALPADARRSGMERAVGWLSWLGRSTFDVEPRSATPGDVVTYTLAIHNDGHDTVTASLANTPPTGVDPQWGNLVGPASRSVIADSLLWRGPLRPGQTVTMSYQAVVLTDTKGTEAITNSAHLRLEEQNIGFERSARLRIDAPDLSESAFTCAPSVLRPGEVTTCTMTLRNTGSADASKATAAIHPPGSFSLTIGSLRASHGGIQQQGRSLIWSGPLMANGTATLRFQLTVPSGPVQQTLYGVTYVDDGVGGSWERPTWLRIAPWSVYLPIVMRGS